VASAKGFAFGGEYDNAHGLILADYVKLALQFREHRLRQGIEGLRPVQR
jgi:hypothetical protein